MLRYSREKMKVEDGKSEAFVRDFPQFLTVEIVKMKHELAVPRCGRSDHDPGTYPSSEARFVLQNTEFRIR